MLAHDTLYMQLMIFVQQVPPAAPLPCKKSVDVKSGPFVTFSEKKVATLMQKLIVPGALPYTAYPLLNP